ncbi:hypothetical protein AHMF7605_28660 [Adhaeribacter arboris]|uniref:Lysozyme inhibitor LprI-like N-terminal domain-containing protein n=1 Tax=Adhaeribacter arboris TaxID=2072846 RepID=A0A2T2Y8R3_9BACT|nr:lysozyme inhibitor LprI family protein [Adhaeribacter arboris]PSR51886.1 hypothetical protein AHMF7605_28660 [Adhaeribacter arboris]
MQTRKKIKIVVTSLAVVLAATHILFPKISIDLITVFLLALAIVPWLESLFKSVELPGGLKLEFQDLQKIETDAKKIGLLKEDVGNQDIDVEVHDRKLFVEIAEQNQDLALLSLRIEIEKSLRGIAEKYGIATSRFSIINLLKELASRGIITQDENSVLKNMVKTLNQAAHGVEYDQRNAKWVIEVGPKIIEALQSKVEFRGGNFSHTNPEAKEHWIDKSFRECDWTTNFEWGECIKKHRGLWKKEVDNVYNALMRNLDAEKQEKLTESQISWEKQLKIDSDLVFSFEDMQLKVGREGLFIAAMSFMNRVRQRALELEEILTLLD